MINLCWTYLSQIVSSWKPPNIHINKTLYYDRIANETEKMHQILSYKFQAIWVIAYVIICIYIYNILHCKVLVIAIDKEMTVLGSAYFTIHLAAGLWIEQLLLLSPRMTKLWYKRTIARPDFAEILMRMLHKCTNYTCKQISCDFVLDGSVNDTTMRKFGKHKTLSMASFPLVMAVWYYPYILEGVRRIVELLSDLWL